MELLLNLAWMLLALPALWLWRQDTGARAARRVTSLQCLLALGCALVLLFPVISASDDLHAMRAEIEESATSKRTMRHVAGDKTSAWTNRWQSPPVAMASAQWIPVPQVGQLEVSIIRVIPLARVCTTHPGRAPPLALLG